MEQIYSITEITGIIKRTIEESPELSSVWIRGEISNLTYHSSGHIYFSLKDKDSLISCAFFKYANKSLSFRLEEGMSVIAFGGVSIFGKRGTYQFIAADVRLEGIGELLKKIEQLKKRLLEEGIFDAERKKEIPFLPRRIGIATSPTGAAIRDIIKVAMRRFPNISIVIAPAKVQGADAPESIVRAIEELNDPEHGIDVIIAGRGGGSFEDLMAFNEEMVVRAFCNSRVPIISAVGHQIDHPLSDEAADYAAPTPSAAAEIAVPVKDELIENIDELTSRIDSSINYLIRDNRTKINNITDLRIFRNPAEIVNMKELLLGDNENRMILSMKETISLNRNMYLTVRDFVSGMKNIIKDRIHRIYLAEKSIMNLSPQMILNRGYTISTDSKGNILKSIMNIFKGDAVNVRFADGAIETTVNKIIEEAAHGNKE